ncbi:hypothetical protein BWP39_07830 [Paraburkholderia acidicola]|uniref:Uncharacterized protein n=1 Tax=Paraburkholderia acidicola TaxID=1912599 RepID=A0A2A4EZW6_9BURK|nr:hypothetical protein [Paraburkholderia acidicola]PCE26691.1 hypothetical protein BWP39_07830 [Paraburkholderia acidicola]
MKGGVWPNVRLSMIALAVAGTLAGTLGPQPACAQPSADNPANSHKPPRFKSLKQPRNPERAVPEEPMRPAVPPDLDQRRRDGHMTPEERRLLRQHIEDAVRELYKR